MVQSRQRRWTAEPKIPARVFNHRARATDHAFSPRSIVKSLSVEFNESLRGRNPNVIVFGATQIKCLPAATFGNRRVFQQLARSFRQLGAICRERFTAESLNGVRPRGSS